MDDFAKFQNIAIRFLSYSPRSEKEVRDKLIQKKAPQDILEKVITFLKEQKFLNDEEFARMWIRQRTELNPKSLRVVKMELRQKGIASDIIDSMLNNTKYIIQNDVERAIGIVSKRIDKYKSLSKYELLQKLGPYLVRRGFDYATIKKSIDEVIKNRV